MIRVLTKALAKSHPEIIGRLVRTHTERRWACLLQENPTPKLTAVKYQIHKRHRRKFAQHGMLNTARLICSSQPDLSNQSIIWGAVFNGEEREMPDRGDGKRWNYN